MILGTKHLTDDMIIGMAREWVSSSGRFWYSLEDMAKEQGRTIATLLSARNRNYDVRLFNSLRSSRFYKLVCQNCGKQYAVNSYVWQLRHRSNCKG